LQHFCDRSSEVAYGTEAAGCVALRVKVNQQSVQTLIQSSRSQAQSDGSFSDATF